jgi:oxygen-dependent protoporphyrinogen oxidase
LRARAVVVATQPHVGAGLLAGLDADAADAVAGIEAPPLAVVFLGYARRQVAHPLDGLGYLTPRREGRLLNGAQFCSTMFPGRAPAGHVAVAGYVGGARAPEAARLSADDLVDLARQELADLIGARGAPCVARVRHWPLGLPQYRTDHGARIARLRAAEARRPGLFVTGNYFAGPAIAACLGLAAETAAKADRFLAQTEERRQARSASMA